MIEFQAFGLASIWPLLVVTVIGIIVVAVMLVSNAPTPLIAVVFAGLTLLGFVITIPLKQANIDKSFEARARQDVQKECDNQGEITNKGSTAYVSERVRSRTFVFVCNQEPTKERKLKLDLEIKSFVSDILEKGNSNRSN